MPLLNILNTFAAKQGYDPVDDRVLLLSIINRAAQEIYEKQDLPGSLMEAVFMVPADNIIALPYWVGEVRAMKEYYSKNKIELKDMTPTYSYNSWGEIWRVWRLLRKSPIQNTITNAAVLLTLTLGAVEADNVVITVTGQTTTAKRVSEVLTIPAGQTVVNSTKNFIDIVSITKANTCSYDVTITGQDINANAVTFAVIPNDRLDSAYTLIDVSMLPSGGENGTNTRYITVLFKQPLFTMFNDGDEFPAPGFDTAIVYKALEHDYSEKPDSGAIAMGWYDKCAQYINQKIIDIQGATQKQMTFHPNPYFGLWRRGSYHGSNRRVSWLA